MLYPNLKFPTRKDRPFFYTNFVSTVDGKVGIRKNPKKYWPIGSNADYRTLLQLRTYADALIHGRKTALWRRTIDTLDSFEFRQMRKALGKKGDLGYFVLSNNPTEKLEGYGRIGGGSTPFLVTSKKAITSDAIRDQFTIIPSGKTDVDIHAFSSYLFRNGYHHVLVEGGPTILGAFLSHGFIDEIFLTVAPKIFGNYGNAAFTMVEAFLFPPENVPRYRLISVKHHNNELFLRYRA